MPFVEVKGKRMTKTVATVVCFAPRPTLTCQQSKFSTFQANAEKRRKVDQLMVVCSVDGNIKVIQIEAELAVS